MLRELEMVGFARQPEHHAVITGVVLEREQLRQAKPVSVERHDLLQAVGRPRHAHLRHAPAIGERNMVGKCGCLLYDMEPMI